MRNGHGNIERIKRGFCVHAEKMWAKKMSGFFVYLCGFRVFYVIYMIGVGWYHLRKAQVIEICCLCVCDEVISLI